MSESPFVVSQPPAPPVPEQEKTPQEPPVLCAATYDPPKRADRSDTHTCDLDDEHDGLHHCDTCGSYWLARVGVVEGSLTARAQVNQARRDARLGGTGFVAITRVKDVTAQGGWGLAYERVAPERVMVRAEADTKNEKKDG